MKPIRTAATLLALAALLLPAAAGAQAVVVDTGDANFARYVSLGDSYPAGVINNSLLEKYQRISFPALIAKQVYGSLQGWEMPLVGEPGIPPELTLASLSPLVIRPKAPNAGQPLNLFLPRPYNNLAIPGAEVAELLTVKTDDGGAFDLVLRNAQPPGFTALEQAIGLNPTFVTVFVGGNDVLEAVLAGRVIDGVTLTPVAQFEQSYRTLVGALRAAGAQLALATFPDELTVLPYAATLPPVLVDPATQEPVLIGGNPVPLLGPNGPLALTDLVLLPAAGLLAQGIGIPAQVGGTGMPLPDAVVLNATEQAAIADRARRVNDVIRTVARENDVALVDVGRFFERVLEEGGFIVGGIDLTPEFLTGGIFSLDGFHPTPVAHGILANLFIQAINEHYSASIPLVDLKPLLFAGAGGGGVASAAGATFSADALEHMRFLLRVPSDAELDDAERGGGKPKRPGRGGRDRGPKKPK